MRRICMRKCRPALGLLLALSLAACGGTSTPAPATTAPSAGRRIEPSPGGSRGDPDNPVDRVGAPIVLTGTVGTAGGCVVLTENGRRWALVGAAAARLADGQSVTVRGRPVPVPAGCDAAAALAVRTVG
ncbi:hypothetical protein [Actinoplanes sp. L3-i22]|uniref:hypothetical protein n=1 Tax=Actinoplanes sp. L3-i22 TaxID=2836373 RepID=UPI001C84F851|nr:hypothetical protein [Actinoplanes sp. L3-i22]